MMRGLKSAWRPVAGALILASVCAASLGAVVLQAAPAQAQSKWTEVSREEGVVVSIKEREDGGLPAFRGVTTLNASVYDILAVLNDTGRNTEWMASCREARVLQKINAYERIIYNRTAAPWPVDDRDVVLQSKVSVDLEKKVVWIKFHSIKSSLQGEVDGAVRMPRLVGSYTLKMLGDEKTQVTYQIDADPGGLLPSWLVSQAQEELPRKTLVGLRGQVKKTKGQYAEFLKEWHPDHNGGKTLAEH